MFQINDFVTYKGKLPQYDNSIAQIKNFDTFNGKPKIFLLSLRDRNEYWADSDEINSIQVTENHLLQLGFQKESFDSRTKFSLHDLVISKTKICYQTENFSFPSGFSSGFCVADFTSTDLDMSKYIENGSFLIEKFYLDYPKVHTITELFLFLNKKHFSFNPENVLLCE